MVIVDPEYAIAPWVTRLQLGTADGIAVGDGVTVGVAEAVGRGVIVGTCVAVGETVGVGVPTITSCGSLAVLGRWRLSPL